jgi:hypothetical protein
MIRRMRSGITAIMLVLLSQQLAAADPAVQARERAAVLGVELGPSTPAYLGDKATAQIEQGLGAAGYEVVPRSQVVARLSDDLARCREGSCLRAVGEALGVQALVLASITSKDDDTIITMVLIDAVTTQQDAAVHEVCDLCGDVELSERLGVAASSLRARAVEARERRERLAVKPPPRPGEPRRPTQVHHRSPVPGLALGIAGALAVTGGIYLMAIDGNGTCHAGDRPAYPDAGAVIRYPDPENRDEFVCRNVYQTQVPGITGVVLGAAALAAGAALIVRARGDRIIEIAPIAGGAAARVSASW